MKSNKNYIKLLQLLGGITTCVCINACNTKSQSEDNAKAKQMFEDQISTSELFKENPSAKEDFKTKYENCLNEIISSESNFKYWSEKFCGQTEVDTFDKLSDEQKENFVDNFIKLCCDHNSKSSDAADQVSVENLKEYAEQDNFSAINSEPGNEAGEKSKTKKDKKSKTEDKKDEEKDKDAENPDPAKAAEIKKYTEIVKKFKDDTKLSEVFDPSNNFDNQHHLILKIADGKFVDLNILYNLFTAINKINKAYLCTQNISLTKVSSYFSNISVGKINCDNLNGNYNILLGVTDVYNKKSYIKLFNLLLRQSFSEKKIGNEFFENNFYNLKDIWSSTKGTDYLFWNEKFINASVKKGGEKKDFDKMCKYLGKSLQK